MLFNSIDFLVFFPIVLVVYHVIPNRVKHVWLLMASYYFYMCWNVKYVVLLFTSTVITYISGLLIEKQKGSNATQKTIMIRKKVIVALSFISNLGILFYFKYANFMLELFIKAFEHIGIDLNVPTVDVLLPVGISFYTFQALGYTVDVYRDEIYAEKNFFRYALFVSFFPQLVAGPIERSKNLLKQLSQPAKFTFYDFKEGILLMLWGFFLKIVLADRIAIFVDFIYANYENHVGFYLIVATIFFAVQIYCDFAGYSIIAMGAAKMLGINLIQNFDAPYISTSVAGFWRRWHISLTSWFKDYLYIPLGGSRKGKARKYLNKMIVFLVSGLWHGAALSFIVWGGLNGLYQIIGELLMPVRNKAVKFLGLNRNSFGHKLIHVVGTFLLVDFSWIFFRALSLTKSIKIVKSICKARNIWVLFDGSLYSCGLSQKSFYMMIIAIVLLVIVDLLKHNSKSVIKAILNQEAWFQVMVIVASSLAIILFGIWGGIYDEAAFIYFQF